MSSFKTRFHNGETFIDRTTFNGFKLHLWLKNLKITYRGIFWREITRGGVVCTCRLLDLPADVDGCVSSPCSMYTHD